MLEFLRKHQYGLMLVVAILTIIAFVFLYDKNTYGQGNTQRGTAFKVYGKGYDSNKLQKLDSYYMLAGQLGLREIVTDLRGKRFVDGKPVDFPLNLMILRHEGRKLGISPSNDDVQREVESMRIFSDEAGRYNPEVFKQVSERLIERNFQNADINQIIKDKITLDKLKELLTANIQPPVTEVDDAYADKNQKIIAYAIKRSLDDFKKDIEVTEEEIKERYEENKETLQTEEKRKIQYVYFKAPEFPKPPPPKPTPRPDGISDINLRNPAFNRPPTSLVPRKRKPGVFDPLPTKPEPDAGGESEEEQPSGDGEEENSGTTTEGEADADTGTEEPATTDSDESVEEDGGDPCGSPQDEAATDDEAPAAEDEAVDTNNEEAGTATTESTEAAATTGDGDGETDPAIGDSAKTPKDLAEEVANTLKTEGEGTTTTTTPPAPKPTDVPAPKPTPGTGDAEPPKIYTETQKKDLTRKFMKTVKTKIDDALANKPVDLDALGKDYMAAAATEMHSGSQGVTELFTREDAPDFIKNARPSGRAPAPIETLFSLDEGELSKPTKLLILDREDWILYRVIEIVEPKPLTLEEAREDIKKELESEKADEALMAALEEDAEKIKAEMAGKNSFKESADKLGIEYALHYKFTDRPKELGNYFSYADLIGNTVPGEFSEAKRSGGDGYLVYVAAKALEDDPAANNKKLSIAGQLKEDRQPTFANGAYKEGAPGYNSQIFNAWLDRAFEEADPSRRQ